MSANIANNTVAVLQRIGWYRALLVLPDPAVEADLDATVTEEGWDPTVLKAQAALPEPDMPALEAMVLAHADLQGDGP